MGEITLSAAWAWVLAACSAIVLIGNAAGKIAEAVRAAKAPEAKQDERLSKLENEVEELKRSVDSGWKVIREQLQSTRLSQEALLALLDHGIDGNNIKQMEVAKEKLRQHLLNH